MDKSVKKKRHVLPTKPEERQTSILSTCQQHRTPSQQRKTSVLHSCDWGFPPAATSMPMRAR